MRFDPASRRPAAALGAALALPALAALRGFTVDDAWIPARYAAHLAAGLGYRFNPAGPATDGVTPLPWAPLLALLALPGEHHILAIWTLARALGALGWIAAAALLFREAASTPGAPSRWAALLPIPLSAPLAAWAVAGLETGLVTLLVTIAAVAPPTLACAAAGLAAAFRPELIVLAFAAALWRFAESRRWRVFPLALAPWFAVVLLRLALFGRPIPLSVLAKPSDLHHGLVYVAAGLLLGGAPALALPSPGALRDRSWIPPALVALAHAAAVALAGGDWMPLSRLLVPSFPLWIVAALRLSAATAAPWTLLRAALAALSMAFVWRQVGASAASVAPTRAALISLARPALQGRRAVAALDIGWIGAATDARIIDLAGLTEPAFAALPGGHTSKRLTGAMLADRSADALLFLRRSGCEGPCVRPDGGPFERAVEERLAHDPWIAASFRFSRELRSGPLVYVLLLPTPPSAPASPGVQ